MFHEKAIINDGGKIMRTLYLMRHGQTYFNIWHKIQGATDSPLTPEGTEQARNVGKFFKENKINFAKAYCSTSERASDTLELVTGLHQHQYDRLKELKEQNFGSFEAQDERLNPPLPYKDFFVKYGGEDEKDVSERMINTLSKIMDKANEKDNILVVSHAGAIFNFFRGLNFNMNKIFASNFSNCSVAKLSYNNGNFQLEKIINVQN